MSAPGGEEPGARAGATETQFALLVASIRDYAIFMLDARGHVATWNAGAELLKGYAADEIVGRHISTFYTPEDAAAARPQRLLDEAREHGRVEELGWRVRKDGSRFWADVVITALRDDHGRLVGFAKVTRDLTARRALEEELRRSEESLAATLYSIGDGVLVADEHARVTRINPVAERLTGWPEREGVGRPISEVFDIVNEQTRARASNPVDRVLAEGVVVGLANHTALIARDGTERPIADSGAPIRDAGGVTRGAVLIFRDVTDERRAEEERVRLAQSREAVRLRDEFLSIASHELKTPLTALQLQLVAIRERVETLDEALAAKVDRATKAARRLGDLIEALLDVSRIATGELQLAPEPFDLVAAVRDVVERLRDAAAQARCDVTVEAAGSVAGTWDRLRIEQVLTNLLANALKYAAGTPVEVSVARDDDHAVLRVCDRGPGLAAADLERIFARFERATAPSYGGLGLGLYVARQVTQAHGGTIVAGNRDGGGACFTVRLPLAAVRP